MNILKQPYPYFFQKEKILRIAVFICLIVFTFLIVFKPFNVDVSEHRFPFFAICLIQAGFASLLFFVFISIFNAISDSETVEENWTVLKEILLFTALFLILGIGNFLIRNVIYNNPNNLSLNYFFEEILHTFLIGILVTIVFTITNTERLLRIHKKFAIQFEFKNKEEGTIESTIVIVSKNDEKPIIFQIDQFLFAKAEGNYVEFHAIKEHKIIKTLHRLTLSTVEDQLKEYPFVVRTHRAYLVNTLQIKRVEGNAQGLLVSFENTDFKIPVSRNQITSFKQVMND